MHYYKPPIDEFMFTLEVFGLDEINRITAFDAFDRETIEALLKSTATVFDERLAPLNRSGDEAGVSWNSETYEVTTPKGFREAYQVLAAQGTLSISGPPEYGGMGAPEPVRCIAAEMITSANKSFSMAPGLTQDLVSALIEHGSDEQKDFYVPRLVTGEWAGTMCLTEPQCGTDLGLVTTKAEPQGDGSYALTGTKIWITFGEHDLTDNIIHFVLARLPDAPAGIKGISTFVVPKFIDGERNSIYCTGLEHKMGIHASPTCVMSLEGARGYLVGEPHRGMRAMFTMMNEARLYVGLEGVALGEAAYQTALAFAKDRRQSRSLDPSKRDPDAEADPILVHPDVRRMLLNVKASNEGLRGLAVWIAYEMELARSHPDAERRDEAADLVALLTPVMKSYGTERGFESVSEALQVCGGAGYTSDWNIEQYLRDVRIGMIYEGTNHIQALDLVGRKLPMKDGQLFRVFQKRIMAAVADASADERTAELGVALESVAAILVEQTKRLGAQARENPELVGAVASPYLNLFALTALTYVWCRMVKHAFDREYPEASTKLKTAQYFVRNLLPETRSIVAVLEAGCSNLMEFDVAELG